MTVIQITDTGPGFPPEILEKLQLGEPLDQTLGTQIGIMNTVQRLKYLYGELAQIDFDNQLNGGASVTLYLPELPANSNETGV